MSAHPNDETRALRQRMGTRVNRRANTKPGKLASGQRRPYRATPATQLAALRREASADV